MNWLQRRMMLMGHGPVFAPADEGVGGGGDDGGDSSDGDSSGNDDGGAGNEGDKGGSSILDLADKGDSKDGDKGGDDTGGDYIPPDYLPEHLRGKDADDTLAKVHKAYKGSRDALAKGNGKLEGTVPDAPDGYSFKDTGTDGEPDKAYAELTAEASKPIVAFAQKAAMDAGIPDAAFEKFMRGFVGGAEAAGMPIGVSDDEAQDISAEAEMERLTELVGSSVEASTVVNTVETYANKLVDRGTIPKEDLAEFRIMVGTAESSQLFYRIMTAELGEKPIPMADGAAGSVTQTEAYSLHAQASAMSAGAEKDQAMEEAGRAMKKAMGQQSTGSIKSSVL